MTSSLHQYLESSARRLPYNPAVVDGDGGALTYGELETLANRVRDRLVADGVRPGDRVGLCLPKSIDAVASLFGVLKAGAAYVLAASVNDAAATFGRKAVKAVVVERSACERLRAGLAIGPAASPTSWIELPAAGAGDGLHAALVERDRAAGAAPVVASVTVTPDGVAYVLPTRGPVTQRAATAFVDWCSGVLFPNANDRFSSHAPLHGHLCALDLFVPIKHGGSIVLMPEAVAHEPQASSAFIERMRVSIWCSLPAILSSVAELGHLDAHNFSRLRAVLVAGETFPVVHLRTLTSQLPHPRYLKLSSPAGSDACTCRELQALADDFHPIGPAYLSHADAPAARFA